MSIHQYLSPKVPLQALLIIHTSSHWFQHAYVPMDASDLHSTREWSGNELGFFKVHIFAVPPAQWNEYITPKSNLLMEGAQQLADCKWSAGAFSNSM
jgi:hypothetical protein